MKIQQVNQHIVIQDVEDFDIGQTLECGQCFRFDRIGNNEYVVVAKGKLLRLKQSNQELILFDTTVDEYKLVWEHYFDLERNYATIKECLLSKDNTLKEAIETKHGVRILNQDFFEMLIAFIISQNKQIPHIKQIVNLLSEKYGNEVGTVNNKVYYSFPSIERLSQVSEEEFRQCKTGFRAPYLVDACKLLSSKEINEEELALLNTKQAFEKLQIIKGVGEKIANCVLLFGLSRREAFPVDVWIKRMMENLYFKKETKKEKIQEFAKEQFGEYGGYAQQYLFYYARDNKVKDI